MSTQGLLSPSDIAELADVSRAAVSNWRMRFADFPRPVDGSEARPLFDRAQVMTWLRAQGKPVRGSDALQLWSTMNALRGASEIDELIVPVHLLLAERYLGERAPMDLVALVELIAPMVNGSAQLAHWQVEVSRLREPLIPVIENLPTSALLETSDLILEKSSAAAGRGAGEHGLVRSRTSVLLAAAAAAHLKMSEPTLRTLYDPACGIAEAIQSIALSASQETDVIGVEINPGVALVAAVRALLRGLPAQIYVADVLLNDPTPQLLADIVVAEPPFGMHGSLASITDPRWRYGVPPRSFADSAWLQHVLAHLSPTGRGYLITTRGPLTRGGQEGRIRAALLKDDVVRAVVALPGKLLPNTSVQLALWVVGNAIGAEELGTVLVIDASEIDRPEDHLTRWLSGARIMAPHKRVPTAEVLAAESVLNPARWVGEFVEAPRRQIIDSIISEWSQAHDAFRGQVSIEIYQHSRKPRTVRVQELLEHGTLRMWTGRQPNGDGDSAALVRPVDLAGPLAPIKPQVGGDDERRTEAGDILLARQSRLLARVDREGGRTVARGVTIIRPKPNQFDHDYLAACMSARWNEPLQPHGIGLSVKDLEIPVLPLEEQVRIGEQLRTIEKARDAAHKFEELSAELADSLLRVARHGVSSD